MFCTKCGSNIPDGSTFCTSCGAPVEDAEPVVTEAPVTPAQTQPKENKAAEAAAKVEDVAAKAGAAVSAAAADVMVKAKKINKKWLIIGAAALVVIIVAIILIASLGGGGGSASSTLLYRKSDELYAYKLKGDPYMISDDYDNYGNLSLKEDSLFYTDSGESDNGYTSYKLYYRDINNTESKLKDADPEKGVLVSKDVYSFRSAGKVVVYLKSMSDDGGKLRYNNLKDEEVSIDSDVKSIRLSSDGKKVVYLKNKDGENTLYEVTLSKPEEKTKIASDVYTILGIDTEHYNSYCFLKQNDDSTYNAYLVEKAGSPVKLLSDISDWNWGGEDYKELYFTKSEEVEFGLEDLVDDDMGKNDEDAQYIRDAAEDDPYTTYLNTIYKLDGSEAVEILAEINYYNMDGDYIVYSTQTFSKPSLEGLMDDGCEDWYDIVSEVVYSGGADTYAMKLGEEGYLLFTAEEAEEFYGSALDGKSGILYYMDEYDEDDEVGTLYSISLGAKKAGDPEKIAEDVGEMHLVDGSLYYLTDMDSDYQGTAYVWSGKKAVKIGDDVYSIDARTFNDDTIVLVWQDYEDSEATLNIWNGKTLTKVADDVYVSEVSYKGGNKLFFLSEYNFNKSRGDLLLWNGKTADPIDDDVSELLN